MRIYAGQTANNGVNGLPDAIVLAPIGGNAVENDAGIISFEVLNEEGVSQDLDAGNSNRYVRMTGSVRLESIDVAPDPLSYFTVVEERSINSPAKRLSLSGLKLQTRQEQLEAISIGPWIWVQPLLVSITIDSD